MPENTHNSNYSELKNDKIYQRLARYLDDLPAGFPSTESGVELRILRRFFTPDEAELTLSVSLIPEESRVIARRAKINVEEAEERLELMARKGLLYSIESENRSTMYMVNQMVIGLWEYHVNDLDHDLIKDFNEYLPSLMKEAWKVPQLRTIPVNESITPKLEVTSYEVAEEIIKKHERIVVAPCICRRERTMIGEGCQAPEEACLVLGGGADYYERNGLGRKIDQQEALDILKRANEAGLVLQPSNAQKVASICCCCGCCCGVLRTIKRFPKPVELVSSAFYVVNNIEDCEGCGDCIDRCQVDALTLKDDKSIVNLDRCIGCGLCVTTCPSQSMHLVRKPENEQPVVPRNNIEKYLKHARSRGKLGSSKVVMMQIKSKLDRLLATK